MQKILNHKLFVPAMIVVAVLAGLAGFYHIPAEFLAGAGLLPLAAGTVGLDDVKRILEDQGEVIDKWTKKHDARLGTVERELGEIIKKAGRPPVGATLDEDGNLLTSDETGKIATLIDAKSGTPIPVLEHKQALASIEQRSESLPSMGRLLRGIVSGGRAHDADELAEERKALGISSDPSGGYTVQGALASEWIDALRANMVLSRAGARTVPMDSKSLTLAKVTGDPTVTWHAENADLAAADPTFGAVTLNAKTVLCLVKLSLELSQDSANIEQILASVLTSALSHEIDQAGLVGKTTDAAISPAGIMNAAGRNKVTSIGAPTSWDYLVDGMYELMLDNVPAERIGAFVAHPAVWKKMRKLKTGISSDNTPLTMPAEIAVLPKYWTTAAPLTGGTTAAGIVADWRDLLFGVRKEITVQVLTQSYLGSNLQLGILAYARCDFASVRDESFCTLEGITV
ncbi:MAG: phage major capsid protein [Sterolibacterium sp.]